MKAARVLLRIFGWLLTPIVAWAASFLGAWLAASWSQSAPAMTSLWISVGSGGVSAVVALLLWLRLLRRSPELRRTLDVAPDGTPVAALNGEDDQP